MYQIVYDFILTHLFASEDLDEIATTIGGASLSMSEWLSHTMTIASMVLLFVFAVFMLRWVFKFVGGLFLGVGK